MPELNEILSFVIATIGTYEANSLIIVFAITVAVWILLFGYLFSTGSEKPKWRSGALGHRLILLWSWIWISSAVCVVVSGWGFFTWRLSNGVMLVPTAPELLEAIIFGYVLLAAAVLLLVGWLPRTVLPSEDRLVKPLAPVSPLEAVENPLYQPLYPGLSFDHKYPQNLPEAPAPEEPARHEPPAEIKERRRSRGRWVFAAGVAVLVLGIVGAIGKFGTPLAPAAYDRLALADITASVKGLFGNGSGDVIRDDAFGFQSGGKEVRDGDFAFDVDQWRPLHGLGFATARCRF